MPSWSTRRADARVMSSPSNVTRPALGGSTPEIAFQRGGLARAVGTDETHKFALVHFERKAAHRGTFP
jgi:hypothetical protein